MRIRYSFINLVVCVCAHVCRSACWSCSSQYCTSCSHLACHHESTGTISGQTRCGIRSSTGVGIDRRHDYDYAMPFLSPHRAREAWRSRCETPTHQEHAVVPVPIPTRGLQKSSQISTSRKLDQLSIVLASREGFISSRKMRSLAFTISWTRTRIACSSSFRGLRLSMMWWEIYFSIRRKTKKMMRPNRSRRPTPWSFSNRKRTDHTWWR